MRLSITQIMAASRPSGCSAAFGLGGLVIGSLLLPAHSLHAASAARAADTRSPHAHRATLQNAGPQSAGFPSSGKAPAHLIHDSDTHPSRMPDKAVSHHGDRSASHSSAHAGEATPKGAHVQKHTKDTADQRHTTKAQGAHDRNKRPKEQLVDEPMPVHRAQVERKERWEHEASARIASKAIAPRHASKPEAAPAIQTAQIGTGLTTDDFLRGARRTASLAVNQPASEPEAVAATPISNAALPTGVSHPDDEERLPRQSAASFERRAATSIHIAEASLHKAAVTLENDAAVTHTQHPGPPAHTRATPAPAVVVSALSESAPPSTEVVEGFGAEVDFSALSAKPARSASITLPKESPAQQERELRAAADIAAQPMFVPLYARDGKLIVPPPLKGSHDILVHQNQMADDAGLTRIQDDDDLDRLRRAKLLVDFPESASLHVNESLPENRRSARPWAVKFATDLARSFYAKFGEPLQVNSAVRTVAYQLRLQRTNGNAAAIDGEGASPHLTGQAIDFGKRGMSVAEIAWMRSSLMPLIDAGKIDVEEEFQQACFHISVYAAYVPAPKKPHAPAVTAVAQVSKPTHAHAGSSDADDNLR